MMAQLDPDGRRQLNIDRDVRSRYLRLRRVNQHEEQRLAVEITRMRSATISALSKHMQDAMMVSRLLGAKGETTGWFEEAINPGKALADVNVVSELTSAGRDWWR